MFDTLHVHAKCSSSLYQQRMAASALLASSQLSRHAVVLQLSQERLVSGLVEVIFKHKRHLLRIVNDKAFAIGMPGYNILKSELFGIIEHIMKLQREF